MVCFSSFLEWLSKVIDFPLYLPHYLLFKICKVFLLSFSSIYCFLTNFGKIYELLVDVIKKKYKHIILQLFFFVVVLDIFFFRYKEIKIQRSHKRISSLAQYYKANTLEITIQFNSDALSVTPEGPSCVLPQS